MHYSWESESKVAINFRWSFPWIRAWQRLGAVGRKLTKVLKTFSHILGCPMDSQPISNIKISIDKKNEIIHYIPFLQNSQIHLNSHFECWLKFGTLLYLLIFALKKSPKTNTWIFTIYLQNSFIFKNELMTDRGAARKNTDHPDFHHGWSVGRPRIVVFVQHCNNPCSSWELWLQSCRFIQFCTKHSPCLRTAHQILWAAVLEHLKLFPRVRRRWRCVSVCIEPERF